MDGPTYLPPFDVTEMTSELRRRLASPELQVQIAAMNTQQVAALLNRVTRTLLCMQGAHVPPDFDFASVLVGSCAILGLKDDDSGELLRRYLDEMSRRA